MFYRSFKFEAGVLHQRRVVAGVKASQRKSERRCQMLRKALYRIDLNSGILDGVTLKNAIRRASQPINAPNTAPIPVFHIGNF